MLIGILQTGQAPDALTPEMGDYPDMFQRLLGGNDFTFRTWRVADLQLPSDVHQADGWLITGSRHGTYEDHPFIRPLEDFIRKVMDAGVPLVGICFGHQIVAQALGGKVERYEKGWSVGPTDYDFEGEKITLNAWHRDQVTRPPEGAKIVASSEFCENAALVYGNRAFTVQAHPEFRDEFIDGLMKVRGKGLVPDETMAKASARLGKPNDDAKIARRIADFFKHPQG